MKNFEQCEKVNLKFNFDVLLILSIQFDAKQPELSKRNKIINQPWETIGLLIVLEY